MARVLTARNRVAGVRTDEGDVVQARIVVCDTTPRGLLALAQDALPDAYVRRLVAFRYGPSTVKVDWALDGPVPWTASLPRTAGRCTSAARAREITDALEASEAGRVPEHPFLLFGQQSIADPTRAPGGQAHRVGLHPRSAQHRLGAGARALHGSHRGAGRALRARLPRPDPRPPHHGSGDLQARNDNLEHGDVGGGSYELDQLVFRPVPSLSPYRTPLRGLYLGSASAFPGGAVHGIPGDAAGRAALQDAKLRRV